MLGFTQSLTTNYILHLFSHLQALCLTHSTLKCNNCNIIHFKVRDTEIRQKAIQSFTDYNKITQRFITLGYPPPGPLKSYPQSLLSHPQQNLDQ